jgi:hypothetical protein
MTPRAVATEFTRAIVADDFDAARQLLCPGTPDPEGQGSFPFDDGELVGVPSSEAPPDTFVDISGDEPAPDLYVRFEAMEEGEPLEGSIEVTFGTHGVCRGLRREPRPHRLGLSSSPDASLRDRWPDAAEELGFGTTSRWGVAS